MFNEEQLLNSSRKSKDIDEYLSLKRVSAKHHGGRFRQDLASEPKRGQHVAALSQLAEADRAL